MAIFFRSDANAIGWTPARFGRERYRLPSEHSRLRSHAPMGRHNLAVGGVGYRQWFHKGVCVGTESAYRLARGGWLDGQSFAIERRNSARDRAEYRWRVFQAIGGTIACPNTVL